MRAQAASARMVKSLGGQVKSLEAERERRGKEAEALKQERTEFALRIRKAILEDKTIYYADESSFNGWVRK